VRLREGRTRAGEADRAVLPPAQGRVRPSASGRAGGNAREAEVGTRDVVRAPEGILVEGESGVAPDLVCPGTLPGVSLDGQSSSRNTAAAAAGDRVMIPCAGGYPHGTGHKVPAGEPFRAWSPDHPVPAGRHVAGEQREGVDDQRERGGEDSHSARHQGTRAGAPRWDDSPGSPPQDCGTADEHP
jgi:hypothetical protein